MKKKLCSLWCCAFAACALSLLFVSCGGGGGGGSDDYEAPVAESGNTTSESGSADGTSSSGGSSTTADEFVLVSGGTVTGGDKFSLNGWTANYYKGAFVAGRTVTIASFYICDHEVTQAEYQTVMGSNPSHFSSDPADGEMQENRPVEEVSWYAALVYCNKRSMAEGLTPCYTIGGSTNPSAWGNVPTSTDSTWDAAVCDFTANGYRLPMEVEWEYAARGGASGCAAANPTDYAGTDDSASLENYAWYTSNSGSKTHEVKTKTKNSLDLYDMSGNVWEMCWDWYSDMLSSDTPSTGASFGSYRVFRGGGWGNDASPCSVALRNNSLIVSTSSSASCSYLIGFRVVRTAN